MNFKSRHPGTCRPGFGNRIADADVAATPAFTLIEMLGVLAIVAILATVILSTTTRRLDIIAGNLETTNLANYAAALQNSILRTRRIPGPGRTDWATNIASELGASVSSVTNNPRNLLRCFLIDPNIQIGVNGGGLPYQQSIAGSVITNGSGLVVQPNVRVMILTSLGAALPSAVINASLSVAQFQNIWTNQDGSIPTDAIWSGFKSGDDLKVQRINLDSLFVQLVLYNYPPFSTNPPGRYAIDHLATNSVPNATIGMDAYFLRNTILGLYEDPAVPDPQAEQILSRDASFVYIQQVWRGTLDLGQGPTALELAAGAFISSPTNAAAITPPQVVNAISNFMSAYNSWANASFPASGNPQHDNASAAQATMVTNMSRLITGP